ncbi:MAG TPA: tryptophan--tRNA ligase, partial [Polyangiaceae bacterium]
NPEQLGHCNAEAPLLARTPSTGTSSCEAHLGQWASIRTILAHDAARLGQTTLASPASPAYSRGDPMKTVLTGIKPTGAPHLGNYLGAIRPALALAENPANRALYFVADYHAFTTVHDAAKLRESVYEVTATWLACGLDPSKTCLFLQSRVPETFELCWVLLCCLSSGQLERGHAYKSALDRAEAPNGGVFAYPALMAADILLYDVDQVPVGQDQKQHVEVARDVALRFNHAFGDTLRVPNAVIGEGPLVPGLDGRKMSKSYDNTVPLFLPQKELRAAILRIKTGSEPLNAPKEAEPSSVYQLFRLLATPERAAQMVEQLASDPGYGWGHAKQDLYQALEAELAPKREQYLRLRADVAYLDEVLERGSAQARELARATMEHVRSAIGIRK